MKQEKRNPPDFAKNINTGHEQFKIGVLLKRVRLEAGLMQEEVAKKLKIKKTTISRIETHAEDIRFSTLMIYAQAVEKNFQL